MSPSLAVSNCALLCRLCGVALFSGGKKKRDDEAGGSIGSIGSLNGGSLDGLSTAGVTISPPGALGPASSSYTTAITDNSVPGLPPLTATAPAMSADHSDPFADFFK